MTEMSQFLHWACREIADLITDERLAASIVITPPADVIYAGQSRGFSARVQHAGGKVPEVRVSFMP